MAAAASVCFTVCDQLDAFLSDIFSSLMQEATSPFPSKTKRLFSLGILFVVLVSENDMHDGGMYEKREENTE